jgi:AraC-like DNA-binding protein
LPGRTTVGDLAGKNRGDLLFAGCPQARTKDVDEASHALAQIYTAASIQPLGLAKFDMRLNAVQLPALTAGYLHFGTDVSIRVDEVGAYFIDAPLTGMAVNRWHDGRFERTAAGSLAVFTPGMPCELDWSSDCGQVCIKIPEAQMNRQLEAMLNRPVRRRVTFARGMNLHNPTARNWLQLIRVLAHETCRPDGVLAHRLAKQNLQRLVVEGLLLTQPHNYAEALAEDDRPASAGVVTHAIDMMHAYPEFHWSSSEIAHATGVSVRALQKAFQRSGHPAPMTYLRRLRLQRAQADLAISSPRGITVTTVAGRWGFPHLGRFAQQYRQAFGESPSETLRGWH